MSEVKIFVPVDAAARSMGADETARAIIAEAQRRQLSVEDRAQRLAGPFVARAAGRSGAGGRRYAYGPVSPGEVAGLFDAGFAVAGRRAARRARIALGARTDRGDSLLEAAAAADLRAGRDHRSALLERLSGAWRLSRARRGARDAARANHRERERVGATGPRAGQRSPPGSNGRPCWVLEARRKYVVCNADEGDSGTFSDRMLMEGDPYVLIEGMTIAGLATGATRGYIYLRWEYPDAKRALDAAIAAAYAARYLGEDIQGSGKRFDLEVRLGAGAYICGEETSLLESLEGKRGQMRFKPPLPAHRGTFRHAHGDQQCHHVRLGADHPGSRRRRFISTSAWAARAARCRCSWRATSSAAAWSRSPSA